MAGKAKKGSHCIRRKRMKGKMRCVAFSGKAKKRGKARRKRKGGGLSGAVAQCVRWKRVKKGRGGKRIMRCARFYRGPGVPSIALRKEAGIKKPRKPDSLLKMEAARRVALAKHQWRSYRPPYKGGQRVMKAA